MLYITALIYQFILFLLYNPRFPGIVFSDSFFLLQFLKKRALVRRTLSYYFQKLDCSGIAVSELEKNADSIIRPTRIENSSSMDVSFKEEKTFFTYKFYMLKKFSWIGKLNCCFSLWVRPLRQTLCPSMLRQESQNLPMSNVSLFFLANHGNDAPKVE